MSKKHPPTHYCRLHRVLMVFKKMPGASRTKPLVVKNNYVCRWCHEGEPWNGRLRKPMLRS